MIPRRRLLLLFLLCTAPMVAGIWRPEALFAGIAADGAILLFALVDLALTPSPRRLEIHRDAPEVLSVGARGAVTLRVRNRSGMRIKAELHDTVPEPARVEGLPLTLDLAPGKERWGRYRVRAERRGRREFETLYVRYGSRFGLWWITDQRDMTTPVRIYPDIQAVHRFELLARKNRLEETGLKVWRLRGRGGEFDRLREYRIEDEPRHIDWKATAKYEKLISREYTVERNQNIHLLLDCGRSMANETDGISHLDRGINAALMLSYIALAQGDNMGLLAFSNQVERRVGPLRGKPSIQHFLRQLFDLQPRYEASDYSRAYEELTRRQRKRALVILVTHALDEQHLMALGTYLRTMTSRHLMLCVFLRDVKLSEMADSRPEGDVQAFHVAAAAELLAGQAANIARLRDWGVHVLETLPQNLSSAMINAYLDLKARQLL